VGYCRLKKSRRPAQRQKACASNRATGIRKDRAAASAAMSSIKVPKASRAAGREFVPAGKVAGPMVVVQKVVVQKVAGQKVVVQKVAGQKVVPASRRCGVPAQAVPKVVRMDGVPALGAAAFRAVHLVPE
jgi:hypothetical protein